MSQFFHGFAEARHGWNIPCNGERRAEGGIEGSGAGSGSCGGGSCACAAADAQGLDRRADRARLAPSTGNVGNMWDRVKEKVETGQAPNVVIDLQYSGTSEEALRRQFADWPIEGLGDVLIVRPDGTIAEL